MADFVSTEMAVALLAGFMAAAMYFVRSRSVPPRKIAQETLLIIGASSGVGLELAVRYAEDRGRQVKLLIVARSSLAALEQRLLRLGAGAVHVYQADVSQPMEVINLLKEVQKDYNRIDTIVISAGALTVQPVLCVTGQSEASSPSTIVSPESTLENIARLSSLAKRSYAANFLPSLLVITTFLPLLLASSSPRVAVLSSVAAEIPAPSRTIYGANKAALSMMLRSLRIELESLVVASSPGFSRRIGITIVHPASIDTGLRSSALDAGAEKEVNPAEGREKRKAMTANYVAGQVIKAIELQQDEVWLPRSYWWISKVAMVLVPGMVKQGAKKKYGFT